MAVTKVLVVDDSLTMRALFSTTLESAANLTVVDSAADADEARELIAKLRPDVVTLDIEMPGMNGIDFLEEIMSTHPIPVVMLSTLTQKGADETLRALELGAVDYFSKPTKATPDEFKKLSTKLCKLVAAAAKTQPKKYTPRASGGAAAAGQSEGGGAYDWNGNLVDISSSVGGSVAINGLLSAWPEDCPPTIVLQQLEEGLGVPFASRLNKAIKPNTIMAEDGMKLEQGNVYILAHPDKHGVVDRWSGGSIRLVDRDPINGVRPSADLLFSSLAKVGGGKVIGALLSGAGNDGVAGLAALRQSGAMTVSQSPDDAMVSETIDAAIAKGAVQHQLPIEKLAELMLEKCKGNEIAA